MALPSLQGESPPPGCRFCPRDRRRAAGQYAAMSYVDAPSPWATLVHNGADNLPRLALLALVAVAWVTTLAWPPAPSHIRPPVAPVDAGRPGYPLRVELPAAEPVPMDELAQLVRENKNLARLDLDLSGAEVRNRATDGVAGSPAHEDAGSAAIPELKSGEFLSLDYDLAALEPEIGRAHV